MGVGAHTVEDLEGNPILVLDAFRLYALDGQLDLIASAQVRPEPPVEFLQVFRTGPRYVRLPGPADSKVHVLQLLPLVDLPHSEGEAQQFVRGLCPAVVAV